MYKWCLNSLRWGYVKYESENLFSMSLNQNFQIGNNLSAALYIHYQEAFRINTKVLLDDG